MKKQQTGAGLAGFIVGVVVGLGLALAVAVYVTKVPIPFLNRSLGSGADMDAAESRKNKDWDPNAPLYGKNPARPVTPASAASAPDSAAAPDARAAASEAKVESKPGDDPLADLAMAKAAQGSPDPFDYFVQAGAFRTQSDADTQRAKLAMLGWEARVSAREQNGRPVFRVRVGPFTKRSDAEQFKEKLDGAGVDSTLIRVAH
ncbi:sporulation protein [Verminephrobacter aporrectodeae subsp. tuberculatae]|uniref:Sporulation protein n=1 Tax=Verminephrobacter aporrectodeae subsp. tuberculatae TaxID=1110392 RepID=A0ABT3KWL0_9BURK|nr:SPOR domain-containing protein [Verminephrobacter aporrectodeae]MCW5322294.1 sporulation protein [Verminephrobacter aporrectodeae subsp. tuberculatae]